MMRFFEELYSILRTTIKECLAFGVPISITASLMTTLHFQQPFAPLPYMIAWATFYLVIIICSSIITIKNDNEEYSHVENEMGWSKSDRRNILKDIEKNEVMALKEDKIEINEIERKLYLPKWKIKGILRELDREGKHV